MNYRRNHPKRRRSPFSYADRHGLAINRAKSLRLERSELFPDLPLLDPATAALLGLSVQSRIIC